MWYLMDIINNTKHYRNDVLDMEAYLDFCCGWSVITIWSPVISIQVMAPVANEVEALYKAENTIKELMSSDM